MPTRTRSLALVAALILAVAGCASGDGEATGEATTPTGAAGPTSTGTGTGSASSTAAAPASSSTASPSPTGGSGTGAGCTGGAPSVMPAGAAQGPVADVDGDGRPDTAWIATEASGEVRVGIVTAAGGRAERAFTSASPVTRSILVVDVNPDTPPLVLANDGRTVQLWAVIDCSIVDVLNKSGQPYTFSLGFTDIGTGVGCDTVDGRQELVGLDTGEAQGNSVPWTSTVVEVRGNQARNGEVVSGTYTRGTPAEDAAIERLHGVTCGDAEPITAAEG